MLGTTNGDVLGGFGASSSYKKGGQLEAALRQSECEYDGIAIWLTSNNLAGSRKWQSASKTVSVLLVIAGFGLAFIALVGGNGGPRWSGLVSPLPYIAFARQIAHPWACTLEHA